MCERNKAFLGNQAKMIEELKVKGKLIAETAERREHARIWYDHYRAKVAELKAKEQKSGGGFTCGPATDREKIMRNQDKL